MTPANKVAIVMEMYESGLLCKCPTKMLIDDDFNTIKYIREHKEDCEGKELFFELLNIRKEK